MQNAVPWEKWPGEVFDTRKYFPGLHSFSAAEWKCVVVGRLRVGAGVGAPQPDAAHGVQLVAPGKLLLPAGHALQLLDLSSGWKRPTAHRAQLVSTLARAL